MRTQREKTQESKSQTAAGSLPKQSGSNRSSFQLVDNRPRTVAQRKMLDMMNDGPHVKQLQTNNKVLQRKWRETSLTAEYYQWDRPLAGLRWYASKDGHEDMYFIVESANDTNRHLTQYQGMVRTFRQWQEARLFSILHEDSSIEENPAENEAPDMRSMRDYGPFIFKPVAHRFDDKEGRMKIMTAHYAKSRQDEFEESNAAAKSKHKRSAGEENEAIARQENIGRFVYHLTTLKNLLIDPNSGRPGYGILHLGLDPGKGGGKGGACETCIILNDVQMYEGSKKNSRAVVAVTTSPLNIKMYANQRVEHGEAEFAKGKMSMHDLLMRESVLLRFALTAEHLSAMEIDPQHPKDDTVRLIRGIPITPDMIQALTSDGWVPLLAMGRTIIDIFAGELDKTAFYYGMAVHINGLAPREIHRAWKGLSEEHKAGAREFVLKHPQAFPNFYGNIFHRQRSEKGQGLAGYSMK